MSAGSLRKAAALILTTLLFPLFCPVFFPLVPAAEELLSPLLTLDAVNGALGGKATQREGKVGDLGLSGGQIEGTVSFYDLAVDNGRYLLVLTYCSGSDDRYFLLGCGGEEVKVPCPNTGSFDTPGQTAVKMTLTEGGDLIVGSDWYAPDLIRIEIYRETAFDVGLLSVNAANAATLGNESGAMLLYDPANAVYSLIFSGKTVVDGAACSVTVNGRLIRGGDFRKHTVKEKTDTLLTVEHTGAPGFDGILKQSFVLENGAFETRLTLTANGETLSLSGASPLIVPGKGIGIENGVFLEIPFDNDAWTEPHFLKSELLGFPTRGREIAAYYDEKSGAGLILGSLDHDVFKTGVTAYALDGALHLLSVNAGEADAGTRDKFAHGPLVGEIVSSPAVYVGYGDDWREGLCAFASSCAKRKAPKDESGVLPFGFNSWGSLQSDVSYSKMIAISDFIKDEFLDVWTNAGGTVYVNLDSYYDRLASNDPSFGGTLDEALEAFVARCRGNGEKAGIYFTPFAAWQDDENALAAARIGDTGYTFYDAALRTNDGGLWGRLDGGWALDPTHPATKAYIDGQIRRFIDLGFEYLKLDFLTHGALEGAHYDPAVTTGMQAYNAGMAQIDELCRGKMFVNLSISPIFPYEYADGRRISCDAFSSIGNTRHVLSCATACFFEDLLYANPDPDHLVISGSAEGAARCRVTSGVVAGRSFLVGDDLSNVRKGSAFFNRLHALFANEEILRLMTRPGPFLPVSVTPGERCADTFYRTAGDKIYLALFNLEKEKANVTVDLLPLTKGKKAASATELWRGKDASLEGETLFVTLPGEDAAIYEITLKTDGDPTPTPTETPTEAPTPTPTPTKTPTETPTPTPTPTKTPTETPTPTPTPTPTASSESESAPTKTPPSPTGPTDPPSEEPADPQKGPEKQESASPWIPIAAGAAALLAAGAVAAAIAHKKRKPK